MRKHRLNISYFSWNQICPNHTHTVYCSSVKIMVIHSCAFCFGQKFRESNAFTKEITKQLIWRKNVTVIFFFFYFSTPPCPSSLDDYGCYFSSHGNCGVLFSHFSVNLTDIRTKKVKWFHEIFTIYCFSENCLMVLESLFCGFLVRLSFHLGKPQVSLEILVKIVCNVFHLGPL